MHLLSLSQLFLGFRDTDLLIIIIIIIIIIFLTLLTLVPLSVRH